MITENLDFGFLDGEERKIYFKDADNIEHFLGFAYIDTTNEQYKVSLVSKDTNGNISLVGLNGGVASLKAISSDLSKVTVLYVTQDFIQISSNNANFKGIVYGNSMDIDENTLVPKSYVDAKIAEAISNL